MCKLSCPANCDIRLGRTSSQTSRALLVMVWRCPGGVHFKPNLTSYARDGLARSRRTHFPGEATSAIRESIICSRAAGTHGGLN
ncbi:hypothetical protein DERF_008159 [Dermatophagoides farinae]|uniref:Uncharacterized protein n=1 Tax=Dermatophagoides farinae TaxID=6954 RepID=A0A922I1V4_DERFA|nr:hypothetical protein DERF_008159 [Dermatophagoides farinae]